MYDFNTIQIDDDVERIIILRKRLDLKQYQFAKKVGISSGYLARIESYQVPLSPMIKHKIITFLNEQRTLKDELNG